MKNRLLVVALLLLVSCDINGDFRDYCFNTGNCQCTGSDCCSLTTCGEGTLGCCGGTLCQNGQCILAEPNLTLSQTSIDFGHFPGPESSPIVSLQLTNSGSVPGSTYVSVFIISGGSSEFVVDSGDCPSQLAPGASCAVHVSVVAATVGIKRAQLSAGATATCTVSATFGYQVQVDLTGSQIPAIQSSPPGLVCSGPQCSGYFATGTTLSLTVPPPYGVTWEQPCATAAEVCTFTVTGDTQVEATIVPPLVVDVTEGVITTGAIQIDPGATLCSGHCELGLSGAVTLTAVSLPGGAATATVFQGWSGACAGATGLVCSLNVTSPTKAEAGFVPVNSVFVTGPIPISTFGADGAGADAACNAAAPDGPTQHYIAWLASSVRNPATLLAGATGWTADPFDASGLLLAPYLSDITGARLWSPLNCFATCGYAGPIITGANPDGTNLPEADTCEDWTSSVGSAPVGTPNAIGYGWSVDLGAQRIPCSASASLACFGTSVSGLVITQSPSSLYNSPYGITFLSSPWMPAGGVSEADQHCQSDAMAAALSGTFIASIDSSTPSTLSAFIRADGAIYSGFTADSLHLDNVDAFGNGVIPTTLSDTYVWTGQSTGCTDCCNEWTGGAAFVGAVTRFDVAGTSLPSVSCTEAHRLYCFQVE